MNYESCKKSNSSNSILLPENDLIFNGEPFECIIYLGSMLYASPPNDKPFEIIQRINDVATRVDLIAWVSKSFYHGEILTIANTNITVLPRWNIVQIVEMKL